MPHSNFRLSGVFCVNRNVLTALHASGFFPERSHHKPHILPSGIFMSSFCRIGCLGLLLIVLSLLPACNALNPLCGSARPVPILNSISPKTMMFSQVPASFVLTATGGKFVASSVVVFNGAKLATSVNSSSQLTVTIISSMITGPGAYNVLVQTPAGNSGNVGCSSGGTSSTLTLTVT
jgi:hypothetical protein